LKLPEFGPGLKIFKNAINYFNEWKIFSSSRFWQYNS
jgi:hypothetical protein